MSTVKYQVGTHQLVSDSCHDPQICSLNFRSDSRSDSKLKPSDSLNFRSDSRVDSRFQIASNLILSVMIHHMIYPITVAVLHQVFDPYGYVNKIIITSTRTNELQALIQFDSSICAAQARNYLQGKCIYDGCCQMVIQYFRWDSNIGLRSNIDGVDASAAEEEMDDSHDLDLDLDPWKSKRNSVNTQASADMSENESLETWKSKQNQINATVSMEIRGIKSALTNINHTLQIIMAKLSATNTQTIDSHNSIPNPLPTSYHDFTQNPVATPFSPAVHIRPAPMPSASPMTNLLASATIAPVALKSPTISATESTTDITNPFDPDNQTEKVISSQVLMGISASKNMMESHKLFVEMIVRGKKSSGYHLCLNGLNSSQSLVYSEELKVGNNNCICGIFLEHEYSFLSHVATECENIDIVRNLGFMPVLISNTNAIWKDSYLLVYVKVPLENKVKIGERKKFIFDPGGVLTMGQLAPMETRRCALYLHQGYNKPLRSITIFTCSFNLEDKVDFQAGENCYDTVTTLSCFRPHLQANMMET